MKSPVWGLPNLVPDDAPAYWGARAILRQGFPEVLGDRKDFQINSDEGQEFNSADRLECNPPTQLFQTIRRLGRGRRSRRR